jgi:hypothetical protein
MIQSWLGVMASLDPRVYVRFRFLRENNPHWVLCRSVFLPAHSVFLRLHVLNPLPKELGSRGLPFVFQPLRHVLGPRLLRVPRRRHRDLLVGRLVQHLVGEAALVCTLDQAQLARRDALRYFRRGRKSAGKLVDTGRGWELLTGDLTQRIHDGGCVAELGHLVLGGPKGSHDSGGSHQSSAGLNFRTVWRTLG